VFCSNEWGRVAGYLGAMDVPLIGDHLQHFAVFWKGRAF
jgi:hypothetical protein